jgi:hypothetical protein
MLKDCICRYSIQNPGLSIEISFLPLLRMIYIAKNYIVSITRTVSLWRNKNIPSFFKSLNVKLGRSTSFEPLSSIIYVIFLRRESPLFVYAQATHAFAYHLSPQKSFHTYYIYNISMDFRCWSNRFYLPLSSSYF